MNGRVGNVQHGPFGLAKKESSTNLVNWLISIKAAEVNKSHSNHPVLILSLFSLNICSAILTAVFISTVFVGGNVVVQETTFLI